MNRSLFRSQQSAFSLQLTLFSFILKLITVCCLFNAFSNICSAQDIESEALYKRGLALFQEGKYISARLDFSEIITRHPSSKRVTSAFMMLSKSYYEQGDYDLAESTAISLRRSHPGSRYAEWTEYIIAACRFRRGKIEEAVSILAGLAGSTEDDALKSRALGALRYTILPRADRDMFYTVLEKNGIKRSAIESVELLPQKDYTAKTSPLTVRAWKPQSTIKIGLLTPLTGANSLDGYELLKGVRAALSNYSEINGVSLELLIEDTESNSIQTVIKTRKLINDGVMAVIGPVYGESTITAALQSNAWGIPFLAPTAPDMGLSLLGPYVFQLNQTPVIQAEALADFAVSTLGFTNSAVIASNDWWGLAVSDTFSREFERRGGTVLRIEIFEPDVNLYNYDELIMNIRNFAPASISEADSIVVYDYGNAFPDTVIVKPDPRLSPQRLKPVDSIDCILISAFSGDAVNIARQIKDYHIETTLLGDSGWSDESVSRELGQYGEGAYLISTATDVAGSPGSSYFTDDFRKRKIELASITSKKGYDTCALLIHCLAQGTPDPETLVTRLESVRDFRGLSSLYNIDPERHINTAVEFVQIRSGRLVKFDILDTIIDEEPEAESRDSE